ncbi:hypothetical protein [Bdellovibrio sp. BCCA]|uniref:hypothetical protein n=1 Tax=Bdellovibrio sp. BCCA TaxID=3136281 RepID=UPI0030F13645
MKKMKVILVSIISIYGSLSMALSAPFGSVIQVPEGSCIASVGKASCFEQDNASAACVANILVQNEQGVVSQVDLGLQAGANFSPTEPRNPFRETTTAGAIGATLEWPFAAVAYIGEEATKHLVLKNKVEKAYQQLLSSDEVAQLKCR